MKFFSRSTADAATASVADENGKHQSNDEALATAEQERESAALEAHIRGEDPAAAAALQLESFQLMPGAKNLLDRAVDNLSQNDGAGLDDPEARASIKQRAELIDAAGNDLSVVIAALCAACEDNPRDIPGAIYSLSSAVMKAAVYLANLDYRRYLDPRGDFDLWSNYGPSATRGEDGTDPRETATGRFATDPREEQREPPAGLDSTIDREFDYFRATYGMGVQDFEDVFAAVLSDIRLFLQLTCEAMGWDPERPLPFVTVMETDGKFTPITDAQAALDHEEVKRRASLKRRRERESVRMTTAAELAQRMVRQALAR